MAIGEGKCLNPRCGKVVAVLPTKGGGRNWSCRHCGISVHTRADSDAKNDLDAMMTKKPGATATPSPTPSPTPTPAPAVKKTAFGY